MDDRDELAKFKASLKAPFPFVPDPDGNIVKAFHVKTPVLSLALRFTFVVGEDRKILKVDTGRDAVDPSTAIVACSIPPRKK